MFNAGRVRGSLEASSPLIIGPTTVYVHTNIERIEEYDEMREQIYELYEYDEIQYSVEEYIELLSNEKDALNEELHIAQDALDSLIMDDEKDARIASLEEQLEAAQMAIDEILMGDEV